MLDIKKARAKMEEEGIDVLVALTTANVYYASGIHAPHCKDLMPERIRPIVIPKDSEPFVIASDYELDDIKAQSRIKNIVPIPTGLYGRYDPGHGDHHAEAVEASKGIDLSPLKGVSTHVNLVRNPILFMVKALKDRDLHRSVIAVDSTARLTALGWQEIKRALPHATIKDGHEIWAELCVVKSEEEINLIGEAVKITHNALEQVIPMIRPGVIHSEIYSELKKALTSAYSVPTEMSVAFAGMPSHAITDAVLHEGQQLSIDIGCTYKWYHSDVARMVAIGEPPREFLKIYDATVEAAEAVISMIKPGVTMAELFETGMSIMLKADPNYRRYMIGHSIGIEHHEEPFVNKSDFKLVPGIVTTVEIPYYWIGHFTCNIEDDVVVTEDGFKYAAGNCLSRDLVINK